ncbi:MAG: AAC(3) family N-acetyltransferase [Clostridia bacterium]|nr:AAC(3) family N-acetyltransferase [Clostridia bacterium]
MVSFSDIQRALAEIGIEKTDTVIVHSSLKSFGRVDGGADTVIDAFADYLSEGNLVFPTLRSRDFFNAYEDWDINTTPSDVGLISETFRLRPDTLRSDQETHSVCALGKDAAYITAGHKEGRERIGLFGNTPFSYSSPWQKMYDMRGKIVMLGVPLVYNTFKHFAEYKLMNDILDTLSPDVWKQARAELTDFDMHRSVTPKDREYFSKKMVWPLHDGEKAQARLEELGMVRATLCGECRIITVETYPFVEWMYDQLLFYPEEWAEERTTEWINDYGAALRETRKK